MKMTIDEAIEKLSASVLIIGPEDWNEARDIINSTARKYQKIEQIVEHWACCGNPSDSMIAISEVLEDGKDDN